MSVRDHGPGLPGRRPERLFERFWRAEGGRERGRAGAGLGLAIVGAVVDAHGGHVSAGNADGGGALFIVVLPKTPPAPAPPRTPGSARAARARAAGPARPPSGLEASLSGDWSAPERARVRLRTRCSPRERPDR